MIGLSYLLLVLAAPGGDLFRDLSFDAALKEAAKTEKVVFVDFFTTWCAPCKKLDKVTWTDANVRAWLAENTVPLKIDAERERELAQRYGVGAFPSLVFLAPDGTELDRLVGFREPQPFLDQARKIVAGETVLDGLRMKLAGRMTDVTLRLDFGRELARRGRSAEALEHFLWVWDEGLKYEPAYVGVRGSFLLGDIARLGAKYPQALDALRKRRDACVASITAGTARFQDALDVASLNRTLKEPQATLEVYEALQANDTYPPEEAQRMRSAMYREVVDILLEQRRYADLLAGVDDPEGAVEHEIEMLETHVELTGKEGEEENAYLRRNVVQTGGKYYEALLGTQQDTTARAVRERLLEIDASSATFKVLVKHAARAEASAELDALGERARALLPEKEAARIEQAANRKAR